MSSRRLQDTNELLRSLPDVERLLSVLESISAPLFIDWEKGIITVPPSDLAEALNSVSAGSFSENGRDYALNARGMRLLLRLLIPLNKIPGLRHERYIFDSILGVGTESIVYTAKHASLGREFAIKLFTDPSARTAFGQVAEAIRNFSGDFSDSLILPTDEFDLPIDDIFGNHTLLKCAVFPFVSGATLTQFCSKHSPLSPYFVSEFVLQVISALKSLELAGTRHGDLHADNILVSQLSNGTFAFKVVDLSGSLTPSDSQYSDINAFRQILAQLLTMLPLRNMSIQRHLGPKLYLRIKEILDNSSNSIGEIHSRIVADHLYSVYEEERRQFLEREFRKGHALALFRHEELVDPAVARDLFIPYRDFFKSFSTFGNAILYGNRGSGKSSYMASLAYYPRAVRHIISPSDCFGILFACRQGEFRQYSVIPESSLALRSAQIRDLLITKVIRKTLKVLADLVACQPNTRFAVSEISQFLSSAYPDTFLREQGLSNWEVIDDLYQTLIRHESELQGHLLRRENTFEKSSWLGARDLANFFSSVRSSFEMFSGTRFYVLFDDAGTPNLPPPIQAIVNDLLVSRNSIFCLKVSAERNSYRDRDSTGSPVESSHDVQMFNLSEIYFTPSGINPQRNELRDYFQELVELRLKGYTSEKIDTYLGNQPVETVALVSRLATDQPKSAHFAGWNIVWQLSNSNPRFLLEMISSIFTRANVTPSSPGEFIPTIVQQDAIVEYSEYKLRALKYLPGRLSINSRIVATGQQIFNIATAFGKIARTKLREDAKFKNKKPRRRRFSEMLAIELDKSSDLTGDAAEILRELVRFGVFDDCRFVRAWDDEMKKPLFLFNRIYTPALGMSFRRDIHWRLSAGRFSDFLLKPMTVHSYYSPRPAAPNQAELL